MSPNSLPPGSRSIYNALLLYLFDPAMALLFTLGLLMFIWGLVEFLWNFNKGAPTLDGKKHMLWGVIGMSIMAGAYGLVVMIAGMFSITL